MYDDYNEYGSHSGHSQAPAVMTADDARRQFEHAKSQNLNTLSNFHVETREDGKSYIAGIAVPKALKPVIETGLENLKPFIIDHSDKIYGAGVMLAHKIGFKSVGAKKTLGAVLENTFRWGVIGAKQIIDMIQAGQSYNNERTKLFDVFSPVMQATGANIRTNEVMKAAFDDVHSDWISDMKMLAADIPTLIPMVMLGLQDQHAAKGKRAKWDKEWTRKQTHGENNVAAKLDEMREEREALQERTRKQIEDNRIIREALNAEKEKYIQEELTKGAKGFVYDHDIGEEVERVLTRRDIAAQFDKMNEDARYNTRGYDRSYGGYEDNDYGHSRKKDKEDDKNDKMLRWAVPGASILSQVFKANIDDTAEKRRQRVKSWKMIEHLRQEMNSQCGSTTGDCDRSFTAKSPDDISVSGMGDKEGHGQSLKEYIIDVFQQHERDRQPDKNFVDAKGNQINPLGAPLVARLQPAVDLIAEYIADGRLDAAALYALVGENKVIDHGDGGARNFVSAAQVQKNIDALVPVMNTRETIKLEEFTAKFADPALIQETLKKNLETMKGEEKALFASLFPDDILEQAGMKKAEITAVRKHAHERMYDFVAANVIHQAAKSPEDLKKLGLSEQEVQTVTELAEKIQSGDMQAVKTAVDGRDKTALDAVRTAGLLDQVGGTEGKKFWTERVQESSGIRDKVIAPRKNFAGDVSPDHPDVDPATKELAALGMPKKNPAFTRRVESEDKAEVGQGAGIT